jgi:hypothetical protein
VASGAALLNTLFNQHADTQRDIVKELLARIDRNAVAGMVGVASIKVSGTAHSESIGGWIRDLTQEGIVGLTTLISANSIRYFVVSAARVNPLHKRRQGAQETYRQQTIVSAHQQVWTGDHGE